MVAEVLFSVSSSGAFITFTRALAVRPFWVLTIIVVVPTFLPVILPIRDTVAIVLSFEYQVKDAWVPSGIEGVSVLDSFTPKTRFALSSVTSRGAETT